MSADVQVDEAVDAMLAEDAARRVANGAVFNPVTGEGSLGARTPVEISDFAIRRQWLPDTMLKVPLVAKLRRRGSIAAFLERDLKVEATPEECAKVSRQLVRLRCRHDFAFWAATLVRIKSKEGGDDVLFRLRRPQRVLVSKFEEARLAGKPIRVVLLKARQWGGSTTTQLYMAWLQLWHQTGLNSLIIAHQGTASDEIKDMFDRMINAYPTEMLHRVGEPWSDSEPKMERVGNSGSTQRIVSRNCKIKIGTAERPDGCRGGDYSLVHLSEVGLWKRTDGKSPEDIVRSACSGMLLRPLTMVVMESTANGTGSFFHREYLAAAAGHSQFAPLFIAWHQIEQYTLPFADEAERRAFAGRLWEQRNVDNAPGDRAEPGRYLWWLWEQGATLEAINWYVLERAGKNSHAVMAAEYPTDAVEAFTHSGHMVFDKYLVEELARGCRPPVALGEVTGRADSGADCLEDLHFVADAAGRLEVWALPPEPPKPGATHSVVEHRYLAVVDIGGRSRNADYSVITVFDRLNMLDGEGPAVVAQWYGHDDIDRIAWRAVQIAAFYSRALLVIESNTLETHDRERQVEGGDQSQYILNQIAPLYDNLYFRRQSEDDVRQGLPRKYGFHTNTATKPMVITTLVRCVRDRLYTERSRGACDELLQYERRPNGSYGAVVGHHDDMLMTRAIGLHICYNEMPPPEERVVKPYVRLRRPGSGWSVDAGF